MFELGDLDRAPSLRGSDQRTEHQLQDGSLAERVRDDLETTAFLDTEAFKQIRRPDGAPTRHRESLVGDAGFEVIHEACTALSYLRRSRHRRRPRVRARWPDSAPDRPPARGP